MTFENLNNRRVVGSDWAFERYSTIRHRLPSTDFPAETRRINDLGAVMDRYQTFVFDSFGVLNVGTTAIDAALARLKTLRSLGKNVFVLTNGASVPLRQIQRKYLDLGFDFSEREIVSSRAVMADALSSFDRDLLWAVIAPGTSEIEELPCRTVDYRHCDRNAIDGVIFLSSAEWTAGNQAGLLELLDRRRLFFLIANPDLVAPRESGFTVEPGAYAHEIADALDIFPGFFGKPYANAFDYLSEIANETVDARTTLMIGDTLHTDILGGRAAGMDTALATAHGVLRDRDVAQCIADSKITPTYVLPTV